MQKNKENFHNYVYMVLVYKYQEFHWSYADIPEFNVNFLEYRLASA